MLQVRLSRHLFLIPVGVFVFIAIRNKLFNIILSKDVVKRATFVVFIIIAICNGCFIIILFNEVDFNPFLSFLSFLQARRISVPGQIIISIIIM
jgi:hypothetical protein